MRDLDTNLIAHDAAQARGYLASAPGVDVERGEASLKRVVEEHVDALLCHIEETGINADEAYLTGAYAVAQWLASCANEARASRDLDVRTCTALAAGAEAMVAAASKRFGLNPNGCDATDWATAGVAARESWQTANPLPRTDRSPS